MATLTFEPFEFIDHLKASGMSEERAKALAQALQKIDLRHVATKQDLLELKVDLLKWMIILLFGQAGIVISVIKFL